MSIKLDIQQYCESCCDFEADVTKPVKTTLYSDPMTIIKQTDTVIRCRYANRCHNLYRYLTRQCKEDKEQIET